MRYQRGSVAIAKFPNADGSPPKVRPVVVIQSDHYNQILNNLIVAAVTSNLTFSEDPASLYIDVNTEEGKLTGLRHNSIVSCINLATIHESTIVKHVGFLSSNHLKKVNHCLKIALEIE